MSICIAAAATTSTTTSTMQAAPGASELLLAGIVAAVALTIAFFCGAFRRDSVLGPLRLEESDSPLRMLAITFLGIGLWIGLAGMYFAMAHGKEITEARQRGLEYTLPLRENAILNVIVQLIALIAVLRADQILLHNGLRKLGATIRDIPRGLGAGLIGAAVAIPLTFAAAIFITKLWFVLKFSPPEDHQLIRMLLDQPDRIARWIAIASPVIVAPLFEETIFRGHIQTLIAHTIRRYRGTMRPLDPIAQSDAPWIRWIAICVAAALFAMIHEAGWMMPPLFVLAVCFGYVYERTGKLWAPILMHALFNAISIAIALFTRG